MVMLTGVWGSAFGATIGGMVSDLLDAQNAELQKVEADVINMRLEVDGLKDRPLAGSLPNCMKGIPGDIETIPAETAIPADIAIAAEEAIPADIEAAFCCIELMRCCFCRKSQRTENQTDATKGKNVKRSKIRCSFRVFFY